LVEAGSKLYWLNRQTERQANIEGDKTDDSLINSDIYYEYDLIIQ
jgi:hypothetical protein